MRTKPRNTLTKHDALKALAALLFVTEPAYALRAPDMSGDDSGAALVYTFGEFGGTSTMDASNVAPALDLNMSTDGNLPTADGTPIRINAVLQNGMLIMNPKPNGAESMMADQGYQSAQRHRTFMVSAGPAAKLNTCTAGFTVQAFVRPWFPFQGSQAGNMIIGLSNSESLNALANPNFGVYQSGMAGAEAVSLRVRTGANSATTQTSAPGAFSSVREADNPGKLTEIIATQEPNGVLTVYVNRIARSSLTPVSPVFTPDAKLVIGNELVPLSVNGDGTVNISQQQNWSGEIYHIAVYCRGFTRAEILGAILQSKNKADVVRPVLRGSSQTVRHEARRLVERLTGTALPIDHPMVLRVEAKLIQGDRVGASKIVTGDIATNEPGHPDFLNTVVKQLAMKMSNREETIRAPFNDFAASFIGITRDERSAQELLSGDFYYMADPSKAAVRSDLFRDMLTTNNHYQDIESGQWDIGKVLMRVAGQRVAIDPNGTTVASPDPAGVLTSRAFMAAHAIAGTNRRLVEYAFREFMCIPMAEMADTSASPARIGRDIDRIPGGDATKFETSCKGCHTVMDGFRGAFAKWDFTSITVNNTPLAFTRNTQVSGSGAMGFSNQQVDQFGTVRKMNHNETVFPNGYTIIDDSFVNNAVGTANRPRFGWNGPNRLGGVGVNQFGKMLADSSRFSQCMAKRVFDAVCTPNGAGDSRITPMIEGFALKFKDGGYNMRALFQEIASNPICAMTMGR